MSTPSSRTDQILRAIGVACVSGVILGLPLLVIAMLLENEGVAIWAGAVTAGSLVLPRVIMGLHLAGTKSLSERQKEEWEVFPGSLGFIAAFAYLLRRDRKLSHSR